MKLKKSFKAVAAVAACFLLAGFTIYAKPALRTLNGVTHTPDSITFKLSGPAKFNAFKMDNPLRLIVDFADVEHNLKNKEIAVSDSKIFSKIRSGQYRSEPAKIARVVVELKTDAQYEIKGNNSEVVLSFITPKSEPAPEEQRAQSPAAEKSTAPAVVQSTQPVVEKSLPAAAKPSPAPPARSTAPPVKKSTDSPTAKVKEADPEGKVSMAAAVEKSTVPPVVEVIAIPIEEEKPAAKTAETEPKAKKEAERKKTTAEPAAVTSPAAASAESPKPTTLTPIKKEETKPKKVSLPKTLVSFDFQDADIRDVIRVMASQSGLNIIYGPEVSGTVTITLKNVPFDEAMNLILQMKGLVIQQVTSNVFRVISPAALVSERAASVTFTKVFPLGYANASDIGGKIVAIMNAEGQRVSVQNDERTNSVIVTSTPEGLASVEALIAKLDVRPEQVLIESKIVEVSIGDTKDIGIDWNLDRTVLADHHTMLTQKFASQTPAQSLTGSFTFGYLRSDAELRARLAAAQTKGKAKILSQPRIATLNNQQARILVGGQIPYSRVSIGSGGTAVQDVSYMSVGIQLNVTPTINADGRITMKIRPNVSNVVRITALGPETRTKEAETTVMVRAGETIVIGGLITDEERKDASQIPLLADIPVLGAFFRSYRDSKDKTELMIFVTPYIMNN